MPEICHQCGRQMDIRLLDGKPGTPERREPEAADYERLECWSCYGPGWTVNDPTDLDLIADPAERLCAAVRAGLDHDWPRGAMGLDA